MIRESKLILPLYDNDGNDMAQQIAHVEDALLQHFGGYNRSASRGAWRDSVSGKVYNDSCCTYVIASEWDLAENFIALRQVARYAASLMTQECIYMCLDGSVEFVEPYDK